MTDFSSALHLLADRFDAQWRSEQQPSLSNYLSNVEKSQQMRLLEMLLPIEIEYRQNNGELIVAEDYSELGPEEHQLAQDLLDNLANNEQSQAEVLDETRGVNLNRPSSSEDLDQTIDPSSLELRDDVKPIGRDSSEEKSRTIGPYKLLQKIGEGGMGTVWMAEQEKPVRRRVALKLIKGAMADKQVIARFEAERQAVAMMDHQNIAKILDAGTTDEGNPFFVMELVNGVPINQYCDRNKLTPDERLKLFVPVCKAVQHAHQKGIIHRDLKPSNVLVQTSDGEAIAKVIDFGLAKALQHQPQLTDKTMFTEFGQVVGTLQYMSPEQASVDAISVDTRSDIYSLGVMLYELLAGSTPVEKETLGQKALLQVLEVIREHEPPKPSNRLSSSGEKLAAIGELRQIQPAKLQQILRGELDWIVMKALEKDRIRRYETANDFAKDISNYLNGDAVQARPQSNWYQLQKFVKKNKGLVASVAAVCVLLLAGIAGTSFGLIRANAQTSIAEQAEKQALADKDRAKEAEKLAAAESIRARNSEAAANFQLANARWNERRPAEARELLQEIPEAYRNNFEWRFCSRLFLGSDLTLYGHSGRVGSVAFSADGLRIASASSDNTVRVWDALTGEQSLTLEGHKRQVTGVKFSPNGTQVASCGADNTILIWDARNGKQIKNLKGHSRIVTCLAYGHDGQQIVSGSRDGTVKVWDVEEGREIMSLEGHKGWVNSVAFAPDGKWLISGSEDSTVKIWSTADGQEIRTLNGHSGSVTGVTVTPDGKQIASGGSDATIRVWDVESGKRSSKFSERGAKGYSAKVNCLSFSPDGSRIASGSHGGRVKLWDLRTGEEVFTFVGHASPVRGVAFSPDGERITSCSWDNSIKIWNAKTGQSIPSLKGHRDSVTSIAFSTDVSTFASGSADTTIGLWDLRKGNEPMILRGHTREVTSVSFNADGTRLASGSGDDSVRLWTVATGEEEGLLEGHSRLVTDVAFSPDGAKVASGSNDDTVKIWDVEKSKELFTLEGHKGAVTSIAFSPDGRQVSSASYDGTLKIWDVLTGQEISTFKGHTREVLQVTYSPDGKWLASTGGDDTIRVWQVTTGKETITFRGHSQLVRCLLFSPDGSRLISGSNDDTIKFWDLSSGRETFSVNTKSINCLAVSANGERIIAGGRDGIVKLLDAPKRPKIRGTK